MSDKKFFNNFLTNNKLWNEIQTNPIAHQYLWSSWYPNRVRIHLTDPLDGSRIGNPAAGAANTITRRFRFHPAPANRYNVRIVHGYGIRRIDTSDKKIENIAQARAAVDSQGIKPALGVAIPRPYIHGVLNAPNAEDNFLAWLSSGKYNLESMDRNNSTWQWRQESDYWWPDYQGHLDTLTEKSKAKTPIPKYDKDVSFLPNKYMSDKQKEAYIWMVGGNEMYANL